MGLFGNTPAKKAGGATKAPAKAGGAAKKSTGLFGGTATKKKDDDDGGDGVKLTGRITTGWGGAEKLKRETATWSVPLKLNPGEKKVIRFLQDEPYANLAVHWLERLKGRRSYICIGKGCPLCARGEKPRTTYCFNVAELTDGEPLAVTLEAGVRVLGDIETIAKDPASSPLTKFFYVFKRSKDKNNTSYSFERLRRRADIGEEFPDLNVPDEDELAEVKRSTVKDAEGGLLSKAKLEEVAKEVLDGAVQDDED